MKYLKGYLKNISTPRKRLEIKAILENVTVSKILILFGVFGTFTKKKNQLIGKCPACACLGTFIVYDNDRKWFCYGKCKHGGDIFNLVMKREGVGFREAIILLSKWFNLSTDNGPRDPAKERRMSLIANAVTHRTRLDV